MQLHWSGATRYHDWFSKPRILPRKMLSQAQKSAVIGSVDWISIGHEGEREKARNKQIALENLLDHRAGRGESFTVAAGGTNPFSWNMTLLMFPFQKALGQVRGYNILNLWLDAEAFRGSVGSDMLIEAFRTIHTPENTEFAFIHPYKRWSELSALGGPYESPLTIGPMFAGVYWTIFLGRHHLSFFDQARLLNLNTYQVEWTDEEGLFVRVSDDVGEATDRTVENEMFRLTRIFRSALR